MISRPRLHNNLNLQTLIPWLDAITFFAWGVLLLRYWITGEIGLMIHPNYFWLVILAGFVLLIMGGLKGLQLVLSPPQTQTNPPAQHITLFPPGWSSAILLFIVIIAFFIKPGILTSETALQRGVTDALPLTRAQPQSFRATTKPEDRTLIEWIRTLNAYPEPDAYAGQKANVIGFVVHTDLLPDDYLLVTRFVITCCAVDAYPVALPVKLNESRAAFPPDTWIEVQGEMMTETLAMGSEQRENMPTGKRQLVISANSVQVIPTPANPYDY